jgi:hypothetical protein
MRPISGERISEHVPAATNMNTTIELLLEMLLSAQSVHCGYKGDNWGYPVSCHLMES